MGGYRSKEPKVVVSNPAAPISSSGGSAKEGDRTTSSGSELTSHMIRERNANVWDYYEEVRRIGEGSIGAVSLVRRKKGTEGGSAYTYHTKSTSPLRFFLLGGCCRQPTTKRRPFEYPTVHSAHTKEYALKSIKLRLVEKKYIDELRNEIEVLRSLDHPNIVKAYEVYETRNNIYVLMEYCSGGDLYARAPYTENDAAHLVTQLCSAIAHMHKNGVVHRDLVRTVLPFLLCVWFFKLIRSPRCQCCIPRCFP